MNQFYSVNSCPDIKNGKRVFLSAPQQRDHVASVIFKEYQLMDFNKDFASEERNRRIAENQKKLEMFNKKREFKVLQEAGRRQAVEAEFKKDIEKLEIKRSVWKQGQKNFGSEAYNVITLDYDPTRQGNDLKEKDDNQRFRHGLRMRHLDGKMNSGYNIITGATRIYPSNPQFFN
jgi:hypothetical protein